MAKKIDIFKGKEKEIKANFESRGFDWEKLKAKWEKESINEKLDSLGQNFENLEANSDAHIKVLEKLLGNLEQFKREKGIIDKAKQKAEEELKKKEKEGLSKLRKIADKTIPFGIGGAIFDGLKELIDLSEPKEDDRFFKKFLKKLSLGIGIFFMGKLCGEKAYEKWKNIKAEGLENEMSRDKKSEKRQENTQTSAPEIETLTESNNLSKKEKGYSLLGKEYLKNVSTSKLLIDGKRVDYGSILTTIENQNKSLNDIKNLFFRLKNNQNIKTLNSIKKELGLENNTTSIKEFIGVLDTIAGENANFIFENINLDNILDKSSFKKSFGIKYQEYKGKKITEIPFKDALFLLGYSLPVGILSSVISFLPNLSKLKESKSIIEEELKSREQDFFSKEFISILSLSDINSPTLIRDCLLEQKIRSKIEKEKNEKIKQILEGDLRVFLAFQNSILTILEKDDNFNIIDNFKKNFIDKITVLDLFSIYIGLNRETNLSNIKGMNKILFYSWVGNLTNDNNLRDNYFKELISKSAESRLGDKYLTDEELKFIGPIFLGKGYEIFIKKSAELASGLTSVVNGGVITALETAGIELPKVGGSYDYIDYAILGALISGNFLVYKIPLPLPWKIVLGGAFTGGGSTYLYGILEKKGVIEKMIKDTTIPKEVRALIENLEKEYSGKKEYSSFWNSIIDLF